MPPPDLSTSQLLFITERLLPHLSTETAVDLLDAHIDPTTLVKAAAEILYSTEHSNSNYYFPLFLTHFNELIERANNPPPVDHSPSTT